VSHPLGRLGLLHPFPSALNALLVGVLATVAGAQSPVAATLAFAMLGFQVSIGALNDLVDAPADAVTKPTKPIPAGAVAPRTARLVVVVGGGIGVCLSLVASPTALLLGVAGYGCGVAYDLSLKRRGIGWVAFTFAFPLLLMFAWTGAGGGLPPGWQILLPLAAMAGPALQLANALTDLDHDLATGGGGLAVRLGRRRAVWLLVGLTVAVHGMAWVAIASTQPPDVSIVIGVIGSILAAVGVMGSARGSARSTAWGWTLQAIGLAALAVAWVVAAAN